MRRLFAVVLLVLLATLSCSRRQDGGSKPALTERQCDSILAQEPLPGAPVVGRALEASDQAADRAAHMDSLP